MYKGITFQTLSQDNEETLRRMEEWRYNSTRSSPQL
jgi:hypothetical protein